MLISRKLEEKLGMSCEAKGEREVEALALLAQDPGVPYAGFLDDMKYADSIGPNVRMILTRAETAAQLEEADPRALKDYGICIVESPRNTFFHLHNALKDDQEYLRPQYETKIGEGCSIHPTAYISPVNVTIGSNVVIEEFVSIKENCVIGDGCIIRAGSRIGVQDFEFKREGDTIFGVTHLGGVILGKEVEVQTNSSINKAVYPWDDTVLGDYTKVDDLVHIAHGCKIGKGVMIVAQSGIGGRVVIGDRTWIGFASTIRNGISIGSDARVNMGAVVTKSVGDGEEVTGNFAIPHEKFIEQIKRNSRG